MTELKDILKNSGGELTETKLTAYLEGKLSVEELREVELLLSEESIESDAIEGLVGMEGDDVKTLSNRINYKLQLELKQKKYRNKNLLTDKKWTLIAVCVIILLAVLGYYVLSIMN